MSHIFILMTVSLLGLALAPSVPVFLALIVPKALAFSLAKIVTLQVIVHRSPANCRGTLIGMAHSIEIASDLLTPITYGLISPLIGDCSAFYVGALIASIGVIFSHQSGSKSNKQIELKEVPKKRKELKKNKKKVK